MKKLKRNKKGFTLIEIIVVLVIIGIMIALAAPAVLGYVDKARESQSMNEGRAGYLGAQTILIREKAKDSTKSAAQLEASVNTKANMDDALGTTDSATIESYYCTVDTTKNLSGCSFVTESSSDKEKKFVNVEANKDTTVTAEAKYKAASSGS